MAKLIFFTNNRYQRCANVLGYSSLIAEAVLLKNEGDGFSWEKF